MTTNPSGRIPVRHVEQAEMMAELQHEVTEYEQQYAMPSQRMAALMEQGEMPETVDVVKWCFAWRALQSMKDRIPQPDCND